MYNLTATQQKVPSRKTDAAPRPCSIRKFWKATSWSSGQLRFTKSVNDMKTELVVVIIIIIIIIIKIKAFL